MKSRKVAVVGLGYVGLPVAVAFGQESPVIGFDINEKRIAALKNGTDSTGEVESSLLKSSKIQFTSSLSSLKAADFFIVAVPTPVNDAHMPDLTLMEKASVSVGKALKKGDIVVYESTVYPGVTEDVCVPILEKVSGLKFGSDFKVGYSPERINPGDKEHTFTKITKIVSGSDKECLETVASVYGSVVTAGVFKAESIKTAEMAKVIENTQRDVNIALMNEIALISDRLGISTRAVLEAAQTKWNFLPFTPGLVGGHCIGVDPYYLTYKCEEVGYHPQVILAGRRINDEMGKFIAAKSVKKLIRSGKSIKGNVVTVLGLTFKENCPDIRNSKVIDVIRELKEYGLIVQVCDPWADPMETQEEYGIELTAMDKLRPVDGIVLCVAHREFLKMNSERLQPYLRESGVIVDVKGAWRKWGAQSGFQYWSL